MTPQEAIRWLETIKNKYIHGGDEEFDEKRKQAIKTSIFALEKQIPKKPTSRTFEDFCEERGEACYPKFYLCSQCGELIGCRANKYCSNCGQKICWGDSE